MFAYLLTLYTESSVLLGGVRSLLFGLRVSSLTQWVPGSLVDTVRVGQPEESSEEMYVIYSVLSR